MDSIDVGFPLPEVLLKNENDTLKKFSEMKEFIENFPKFSSDAHHIYSFNRNTNPSGNFAFESFIELESENSEKRRVYVGALIKVSKIKQKIKYENISYYFTICRDCKERAPITRKYHFDHAFTDAEFRNPKFHLQYCGNLTPLLKNAGYVKEDLFHMEPSLSIPRIPYTPMSLALLLNLLLNEFKSRSGDFSKICYLPEWKKLIKKNEDLLLKPFFNSCSNFFNSRVDKKESLTSDFYYGK